MEANKIDFYVRNEHSIIMLYPESDNAKHWTNENLCLDTWQNTNAIGIEPRYFDDIYQALINEGFTLEAA